MQAIHLKFRRTAVDREFTDRFRRISTTCQKQHRKDNRYRAVEGMHLTGHETRENRMLNPYTAGIDTHLQTEPQSPYNTGRKGFLIMPFACNLHYHSPLRGAMQGNTQEEYSLQHSPRYEAIQSGFSLYHHPKRALAEEFPLGLIARRNQEQDSPYPGKKPSALIP